MDEIHLNTYCNKRSAIAEMAAQVVRRCRLVVLNNGVALWTLWQVMPLGEC